MANNMIIFEDEEKNLYNYSIKISHHGKTQGNKRIVDEYDVYNLLNEVKDQIIDFPFNSIFSVVDAIEQIGITAQVVVSQDSNYEGDIIITTLLAKEPDKAFYVARRTPTLVTGIKKPKWFFGYDESKKNDPIKQNIGDYFMYLINKNANKKKKYA